MKKSKEVIRLNNAKRHYSLGETTVKALDGLSLTINEGEFIAIMGPSGSGKSTSMNLIGSLDTPTYGDVFLDKQNISSLTESKLAQLRGKKIGFIFQQFNLISNLTALENVALPLLFQGISEVKRQKKAKELLELIGLGDRLYHYPNQLSGGQQQRVAIARSLANDPELILADEPTGNLDSKTGEIVMEFLDKMHSQNKTVVVVTHDPELAMKHSQKVYWLKDGKLEKVTQKIDNQWKEIN